MRMFGQYLIYAHKGVESWKIVYFEQMKPLDGLLTETKAVVISIKKGKGGDRSTMDQGECQLMLDLLSV